MSSSICRDRLIGEEFSAPDWEKIKVVLGTGLVNKDCQKCVLNNDAHCVKFGWKSDIGLQTFGRCGTDRKDGHNVMFIDITEKIKGGVMTKAEQIEDLRKNNEVILRTAEENKKRIEQLKKEEENKSNFISATGQILDSKGIEDGDKYFFLDSNGDVEAECFDIGGKVDEDRLAIGNAFIDRPSAETERIRRFGKAFIRIWAMKTNRDKNCRTNNGDCGNNERYFINYNTNDNELEVANKRFVCTSDVPMFDNKANAEACMRALEEKYSCDSDLKTIFGIR